MNVRMNTTYASARGTAGPGNVIDLPETEAEQLIAGRYAEAVDPPRTRLAVGRVEAQAPAESPAEPPAVAAAPRKKRK